VSAEQKEAVFRIRLFSTDGTLISDLSFIASMLKWSPINVSLLLPIIWRSESVRMGEEDGGFKEFTHLAVIRHLTVIVAILNDYASVS
jgi:hypothetical protein